MTSNLQQIRHTAEKRLTTDAANDIYPLFSPDGSKIVFISDRTGNNDIWIMDSNGDNEEQLTTDSASDFNPVWSPDSKKITFCSNRDGNYDIFVWEKWVIEPKTIVINKVSLNRNPAKTSQAAFKYGSSNWGQPITTLEIGVHLLAEAYNPTENDVNVEGLVTLESPSGETYEMSSVVDTIEAGTAKTLIYRVFYPDPTGWDTPEAGTWKIKLRLFGKYREELLDEKETTIEVVDKNTPTETATSEASIGNIVTWEYTNELEDMDYAELVWDDFNLIFSLATGDDEIDDLKGSYTDWISNARAAEAALKTGTISIDSEKDSLFSSPKIGDIDTITLTYQNTAENYKNANGDLMLFSTSYDRAVVIAKIYKADSIIVIDDGNADYKYSDQENNSIVLVWITEKPDKLALLDGAESKQFKVKYLDSTGINITADLSLQIGPYPENPYEIINENKQKMNVEDYSNLRDPSTIDYTMWKNEPEEVYWSCIGAEVKEINFEVLEGDYIPVESSTGGGYVYFKVNNGNIENLVSVTTSSIPVQPPSEANLKYGLFRFTISDLDAGSTEIITLHFPEVLPENTEYWKYGPTKENTTSHWYKLPCTIDGNELSITLVDGGLGDDDLAADGVIEDDGGPSISSSTSDSKNDDSPSSNSGSSGGSSKSSSSGGGGGGGSPEPAKNVEVKELAQTFITNGKEAKFEFRKNATCVVYVSFDAKRNLGKTTTIVEMLKGKSSLVPELPEGEVYKSFNVWVGNGGIATPKNIENPALCFKVEKSWLQDNGVDPASITLNRYNDEKWEQFKVNKSGEDTKYLYFTADVSGFSSFTITGKAKSTSGQNEENLPSSRSVELTNETDNSGIESKTERSAPGFEIIFGIVCLIGVFLYRRK